MFEHTLDSYAHSNNLKNIDINFKVMFALLTMLVSLIATSPIVPLIIAFFMSILIIFKARIPWKFYLKFLIIPFSFGLLTFIFMALFYGIGAPILNLGLFNLEITQRGLNLGLLLFTRIIGGFTCLAFLALTSPMTELFSVLEMFKIPKVVLEIAMLMYRYIFLFLDEAVIMYHSQETRLGYSSLNRTFRSMGMLGSNLFIKTWLKGEQTYIAMESRCYDGSIKSIRNKGKIKQKNFIFLLFFESILLIAIYLTWGLTVI